MGERWSPERVRAALSSRVEGAGQLDSQGFIGGRISEGWALRVLQKKGRTFTESVVFFPSEQVREDYLHAEAAGVFTVLSHTSFPILSEWGPVVIIDRVLPTVMTDPGAWVRAATSDVIKLETPIVRTPMADVQFWELIGLLHGEVSPESIANLTDEMSTWPYPSCHLRIIAFWDALVTKLHELDHPGNTVGFGDGDDRLVSADASLYYRCEIIARGPEEFRARVRDPRPVTDMDGACGKELLYVAENVAPRQLPDPIVPYETGTNPAYWPVVDEPDPVPAGPSPGPFSYQVQMARLQLAERLPLMLIQFIAYAVAGDRVREIMGCVMAESCDVARAEAVSFVDGLLDPGEHAESVQLDETGTGGVTTGWAMIQTVRKSRLTMNDYITHYYQGEPSRV
ncbi:hypothetical protein [Microbacterium sp.]|uniref:hypothetical protein n=1 Tax=Microbacterium sp. TaxID=51671 RepID=UPI0039E593B8